MIFKFELNTISKEDLYNLNEDDLMFITNPGRMGDEDGSTFIMRMDDKFIPYRVDGWMYSTKEERNSKDFISIDDMFKVFPKWKESWDKNYSDKDYRGKYKFIYMGFGNGLCVDNRIYDKYYPYLIEEIKKKTNEIDDNNNYDFCLNYVVWDQALVNMIKDDDNIKDLKLHKTIKDKNDSE